MDLLVASPVCLSKSYALDRWVEATDGHDRLLVTDEPDFVPVIESYGIEARTYEGGDCYHVPGRNRMSGPLLNRAWKCILKDCEYTHVLALDVDVIPDGDIASAMAEEYRSGDRFLRHAVPYRAEYKRLINSYETSCTLASVEDWRWALWLADNLDERTSIYVIVGHDEFMAGNRDVILMGLDHIDNDGVSVTRTDADGIVTERTLEANGTP